MKPLLRFTCKHNTQTHNERGAYFSFLPRKSFIDPSDAPHRQIQRRQHNTRSGAAHDMLKVPPSIDCKTYSQHLLSMSRTCHNQQVSKHDTSPPDPQGRTRPTHGRATDGQNHKSENATPRERRRNKETRPRHPGETQQPTGDPTDDAVFETCF